MCSKSSMAHKRKAVQAKEASTLTYGAAAGDRKTGKRGRRSAMPDDLAFGTEHEASKNTLEHPEQSWDVAMTDHFVMAIRHSAAYGEQAEDARHSERKEAATLRQLDYHQQLTRLADDACAGTQYVRLQPLCHV